MCTRQTSMPPACRLKIHQHLGLQTTVVRPTVPSPSSKPLYQGTKTVVKRSEKQSTTLICRNLPSSNRNAASSSRPPPPPSGIFLRDISRSDMASYERALTLLELGKIQRTTAMQLIEGIELKHGGQWLSVEFLTVVPFFKVTERYKLGGTVSIPRRDLRPGNQRAEAYVDPVDGVLHLKSSWNEPNAGSVNERLVLKPNGRDLEYISTLVVPHGTEITKQVYTKVKEWKPNNTWNPLKAMQMLASSKED